MASFIIVDVQYDFLPGGALAVAEGDRIIPVINHLLPKFEHVVATQDWHPADHRSFAANHPGCSVGQVIDLDGLPQVLWPVHCVQGTPGAELSKELALPANIPTVRKGTDPSIDSYSGFFDNGHRKATGLRDFLKRLNGREIFVCGLATDYCVKFTALDAMQLGFTVFLIQDACRGVNLAPGDVERAVNEMRGAGVSVIQSDQVAALLSKG